MSELTSVFAPHIKDMLAWREATGQGIESMRSYLSNFDRFVVSCYPDQTTLTQELGTAWCRQNTTGHWDHGRGFAIRAFGRYLTEVGIEAFVVPTRWIAAPIRHLPHIFSDEELAAFFCAADSIRIDAFHQYDHLRQYTVPVIFRLMLGAGLRPQEARLLARRDYDAGQATVLIEQSKRNKDRRVPLSDDLAALMVNYDRLAEQRSPGREWFFQARTGQPYSKSWLTYNYHQCRRRAGGIAPGSTPYTLRHNYATRVLMRWVEDGRDLSVWLPYLSAYMGHDSYSATAWYVHLLPERLAATGLTSIADVVPAVTR
ncbi:MAG: tyrosine-type recombinase/integrase [bacterium]|jgi:integrase|nr:tyrosine-type recombinase/integrase [bacterium]